MLLPSKTRISVSAAAACLIAAVSLAACSGGPRPANAQGAGGVATRPDKLAMIGLLKMRNYAALEKRLNALQARFEAGKDPKGYLATAFAAFDHSDPGAKKWLDEWVKKYPKSFAARLARGRYYAHLGWVARGTRLTGRTTKRQFERMAYYHGQSMRDMQAALRLNIHLPSAYCEAIAIYAAHDQFGRAKAVFEAAERAAPKATCHILRYARFLRPKWRGGEGQPLNEMLRLGRERSARDPRYKILEGLDTYVAADALFSSHRHKEAVALYDKAIQQNPQLYMISKRGRNFMLLKQYDRALADFERVLKAAPQDAETLAMTGELYMHKHQFRRALDYVSQALALDPYMPYYLAVRLKARRMAGIPEKSAIDLERAQAFGADNPFVQAERAEYLQSFYKNQAGARRAWKRAVELAPDHSYFRRGYWKNLAFNNDCDAVPAAIAYLQVCLRDGECTNGDIVHVSTITNEAIRQGQCPYKKHHVALAMRDRLTARQLARITAHTSEPEPPTNPDFVGETQLDAVTLEGIRPGMSMAQVILLYPDMKIDRMVHPRTKQMLRASGLVMREDGRRRIQVMFSALGEVQNIDSRRTFRSAETVEEIKHDTIAKYGKPNREVSGSKVGLVYRQGGGARDFDAALIVEIERLPGSARVPPGEGEPVRMVSVLTDNRVLKRGMAALSRPKKPAAAR